ncbi:MAG: hypothetical protein AAFQ85_04985 [Pseudomonadota bacterium]
MRFTAPLIAAMLSVAPPAAAEVDFEDGDIEILIDAYTAEETANETRRTLKDDSLETVCRRAAEAAGPAGTTVYEACLSASKSGGSVSVRIVGGPNRVYSENGGYACSVIGERNRSCNRPRAAEHSDDVERLLSLR